MKHCKKIFLAVTICIFSLIILSGCSDVSVSEDSSGKAIFKTDKVNIEKDLETEDIKQITEIFNGKKTYSFLSGVPSCGFSADVSVKIGNQTFCFAMDTCSTVQVGLSYFDLSEEEDKTIKSILEKYGFYFPCI